MGPWPMTRDSFIGLQLQVVDGFVAGVYRFDPGGLFEGNVVGDADEAAVDNPVHDADVFGKAAAGGLKGGGGADLLVGVALGVGVFAAKVAGAAGDVVEGHGAVSLFPGGNVLADGCDRAGHFVAEDAGGVVGAGVDFFQVGAADAAGVDAQEDFAWAQSGQGHGFDADVVGGSVDGGLVVGREFGGLLRGRINGDGHHFPIVEEKR